MNEPNRPRSRDDRLLGGRPAPDVVKPGRSVFDADAEDDELDDDDAGLFADDDEDDFDDEVDDAEGDDEDEGDEDDVELPHWTAPPTGQSKAVRSKDADAWTSLTASQPRWRESAADYDDEPEPEEPAEVGGEAAAEEFFDFDDEGTGDFDHFIEDEPAEEGEPEAPAIPITKKTGAAAKRAATTRPPGPSRTATKAGAAGGRPGARRPSDMNTRVITGAVLAALAAAALLAGRQTTVALACVVLGLCVLELSNALRRAGYQPATLLALVASVAAPVAVYQRGVDGLLVIIAVTTAFSLLWFLFKAGDESPVLNAGVTVFTVCYIGVLGSYAALMIRVFGKYGIGMIFAAVIGTVGHDVGALVFGRTAGRTPLTPVSPGKTREGLFGGMLIAIIAVVVVIGMFKVEPFGQAPSEMRGLWTGGMPQTLALAVVIAITAPLGDLAESLIKRDLGVKDMGNLLKGHGGVLDRFDALLFTLPATYYIARFVIL